MPTALAVWEHFERYSIPTAPYNGALYKKRPTPHCPNAVA